MLLKKTCFKKFQKLVSKIICEMDLQILYLLDPSDDNYLYFMYLHSLRQVKSKRVFDLNGFDQENARQNFRFEIQDIDEIVKLFDFPAKIKSASGHTCDTKEALCILLRRLAYPNRLSDLQAIFDRQVPELSEIANTMTSMIYEKYHSKVTWWNQSWLTSECLKLYSEALRNKGVPIPNCFGFIDGTTRPICRPDRNQKLVYNGHKRVHCLKYQSTVIPNGLIANVYGPEEGRIHDNTLLDRSNIIEPMEQANFRDRNGSYFCLNGDPAYGVRPQLIAPFRSTRLTPEEAEFNKIMSLCRVTVGIWKSHSIVCVLGLQEESEAIHASCCKAVYCFGDYYIDQYPHLHLWIPGE